MAATTKRVLLWLGVAFVVYTIIERLAKGRRLGPAAFGGYVRRGCGQSLGTFFEPSCA
jgi:hypothetical protein